MPTDELLALAGVQDAMAKSHPSLARGQVWCRHCGHTEHTDSAHALRRGWPKHCGYTMTIDSPDEQTALRARAQEVDHA